MSKKDTDDIHNRGNTEEKSVANSNMDHSITAVGAPKEQDLVAPSDTNDDAFISKCFIRYSWAIKKNETLSFNKFHSQR